jgi:alanyl aminopeptidase
VGADGAADPNVVETQLATVALSAAVQEGDEAFFEHLVGLLHASADATARSRILAALAHAESPALAAKALELAFDPNLRLNEVPRVVAIQLRGPRTRAPAWTWLREHFDALVERIGAAQAGKLPWFTTGFCSHEAADEVREFFEPRVSSLVGGPRNLAGAIEAISLCATRVDAQREGIDRAFAPTRP